MGEWCSSLAEADPKLVQRSERIRLGAEHDEAPRRRLADR